jgi:hypothetical protein
MNEADLATAFVPEYDRTLAVLCDSLGADAVAKLMVAGALMTEEEAVEEELPI